MNSLLPVRHLPQSHPAWEVPPTAPSWLIAAAARGYPAAKGAAVVVGAAAGENAEVRA
jgi:hypothetical protein